MIENFNDFVGKKKVQNNRGYEHLYAKNIPTIINLLKECKKNRVTHEDKNYSYRTIAQYMYEVLEMREVTEESLRKIVKRIAIANDLEF
jgi:hypothetical protein|tara:strand:- start:818 stop:1084 length:267 start_codon:yes stop_codon:yes gene_type:complete